MPKVEPIDDEQSPSYYTLKVDMASEDGSDDSAIVDNDDDDDNQMTIDLSMKPRECPEVTTVCCNTLNNNNSINNNNHINVNNNGDGDKIMKGSAKRKKPNPMQIVLAKKSKILEEPAEDVVCSNIASEVSDDTKENTKDESLTIVTTMTTTTTTINTITNTTTTATIITAATAEDNTQVKRKNSVKSLSDGKSEQEKLVDECLTEDILHSVLTDESDGDDMITEAFVKKKGVPKKAKKGRKDRKSGGNKKEMTGK